MVCNHDEDPHWKYPLQNIILTHEYLVNNAEEELFTMFNETYLPYQPEQRGVPLFFKIMLDSLQDNSAETDKYLVNVVNTLKITECDGKNVETCVSLICVVFSRLSNLVDASGQSTFLDDFY